MAPTAIPNPQVTSVVVNFPHPPPVFDRDSGLLLVEAPHPHGEISVSDDVPPDFEASVNGEVVQDNDSLIGETIVTGEHQSSDGSTVSDSLFVNDSIVDGGSVLVLPICHYYWFTRFNYWLMRRFQNIRLPGESPSI